MDMHLHAGMERPVDLRTWIDLAVADGRKVVVLLDHIELYRKSPADCDAWRAKGGFEARYPVGAAGHQALMDSFDQMARRRDVLVFKGWEVSEKELDTGLEDAPMRMSDVLGFHISPNHGGEPPNGRSLLKRAQQMKEVQKKYPVPMVLFHPFPMRMENLQRTAKVNGRDVGTITAKEYRFFQPGEQEELIRLLKGGSIYIEIGLGTEGFWKIPACRQAFLADIQPLADAGLQFIVSTDNHGLAAARKPFHPEVYCQPLHVTPENTNGIIRELLAIRAKRAVGGTHP
jgi:hypothetical protein